MIFPRLKVAALAWRGYATDARAATEAKIIVL
jgi:hypothetical protein